MRLETIIEVDGMPDGLLDLLERAADLCQRAEGFEGRCQIGFVLTDDRGITAINRMHRGLDAPTDVLSFPSVRLLSGTARDNARRFKKEIDLETGCIHLGDIVISLPKGQEQAKAYGHSLLRELCFLFVHGTLHLMGYDHDTDARREVMRSMEDSIMMKAGLPREVSDEDLLLMDAAKKAMQRAYAPYSKYKVGACLRARDGRLISGCNVENASFGMSICAERNALTSAVTEGVTAFDAIAIASESSLPYPCGACRQFMREFEKDLKIILVGADQVQVTSLAELLPYSFGPESLHEVNP